MTTARSLALRTAALLAFALAASAPAAADDNLPDAPLPSIESAETITDVIIWIAGTFGPNVPTEVQAVQAQPDADGYRLVGEAVGADAVDAWHPATNADARALYIALGATVDRDDDGSIIAIELEDGGFDPTDEAPAFGCMRLEFDDRGVFFYALPGA